MSAIRKSGDQVLHQTAKEVEMNADISWLIDDMWASMYKYRGIGLAANQIGELHRVIVVHANGLKMGIINPAITKRYGGKVSSKEGCLSFPMRQVPMIRDKQIVVEGFDESWNPIKRKLKGLAAYCVQHEVDHLDGITIA